MLSNYERTVLLELLSGVNEHDLLQLSKTVSQKLLNIDNRNQALDAILLHSQTVESVLHRKKISKQLLFNYMSYKQLPVQSHMSKEEIIKKLLQYWKTNEISNDPPKYVGHKLEKEEWSEEEESQQQQQPPNIQCQQINQSYSSQSELSQQYINYYSSQSSNDNLNQYQSNYNSLVPQSQEVISQISQHGSLPQYELSNTSLVPQSQDIVIPQISRQGSLPQYESTNNSLVPQSQDIVIPQTPQTSQQICLDIDIDQLSFEFIKWFNEKFNSCTFTNGYPFDSNMFFHNANAELKIIHSSNSTGEIVDHSVQVESSEQIAGAIIELQKTYNIYLNSNYDSLKVTRNSYGNIVIGVCGSLHSNNQLMGVYEHLFQLFNDPQCQLNEKPVWKIQKMLLNLKFTNNYRAVECESSLNRELMLSQSGQVDVFNNINHIS